MQAVIFDSNGKKLESLLFANSNSVRNYFLSSSEAHCFAFIESDNHIEGDIFLEGSDIVVMESSQTTETVVEEGVFDIDKFRTFNDVVQSALDSGVTDFKRYQPVLDIIGENSLSSVNENLKHMYNGGSIETVPNPMPYRREFVTNKNILTEIGRINGIKIYSREEALEIKGI